MSAESTEVRVYLGLGGNLGDVRANVVEALNQLVARGRTRLLKTASWYRTAPVGGPPDQPDYFNSAAEIATTLEPFELLNALKEIEAELGRTQGVRHGPRPVDLDVLIYGTLELDTPTLVIPHASMSARRFVLEPLAEICPDLEVPGDGRTVAELLGALGDADRVTRCP